MTKISAKVIADSINESGNRITSMQVTFPRYILAELNTHRMFSRNSASSRAIPFEKMLKSVEENPFIPIAWMKDHKGMQGTEFFTTTSDIEVAEYMWKEASWNAIHKAKHMAEMGITKQLVNRLLEPFMWHTVIVTATEWENFFYLRCPKYEVIAGPEDDESFICRGRSWKDFMLDKQGLAKDFDTDNIVERLSFNKGQAEIHMMALAEAMWDVYNESTPKELKAGEWHTPFGDNIDNVQLSNLVDKLNQVQPMSLNWHWEKENELAIKIATARCARVSYTVVGEEGKADNYENDIKLHDRLAASGHWSPFEHCARTFTTDELYNIRNGIKIEGLNGVFTEWSGNFNGYIQYRKTFNNENVVIMTDKIIEEWRFSGLLDGTNTKNIKMIAIVLNKAKNFLLRKNIPTTNQSTLIFPIIRRIVERENKEINIEILFNKLMTECDKYFINGNEDELAFVIKFCKEF